MSDDPEYEIDFRARPEEYEIGRGEEGVFKIQPYKDELLPLWGYMDRAAADESGEAIHERYREYRAAEEFPGMDMARKYLQMGYTRAMRYARYPGGQKYVDGEEREPERWADHDKREAALVYEVWWEIIKEDGAYQQARAAHQEQRE